MLSSCYPDVVALKGVVQEVEQLLKNASELIEKLDEATEQLAFDLLKSEGVAAAHQTGLAQAVCGKREILSLHHPEAASLVFRRRKKDLRIDIVIVVIIGFVARLCIIIKRRVIM